MPPNTPSSTSNPISSPSLCASAGGDSPLSTTANVLSILTFALGLFASYVALISATRGAPAEIKRLVDDLRTTQREINRVAGYIFDDIHHSVLGQQSAGMKQEQGGEQFGRDNGVLVNGSTKPGKTEAPTFIAARAAPSLGIPVLSESHSKDLLATGVLYDEVQELLKTCVKLFYEADDLLKRSERDPYGLRRRVLFVMNRNDVTEKMNRLADQKAKLAAIQMSLFLRYAVYFQEG
ncbi:MAG: hypothetical protein Q9182_002640 [Xanthomendoza sp. 2 TL-2023]